MTDLANMRAIILAAGLGTRMRPLTDTLPKPLIRVGGKTLIDHVLDWVADVGIHQVVVNTHYMAHLLETHLRTRSVPQVVFSHEETLLETGGGIAKALPLLGDAPFLSANSDTICLNGVKHALARLHAAWDAEVMDALLLVHPVCDAVGYAGEGDFSIAADGSVIRRQAGAKAPYVFTGVQMLHPRLFEGAPGGAFSLNVLYNRGITPEGKLPRIKALIHDGKWLHVGDPHAIAQAENYL
jgi:N-acetyl-alpha-D-muramate 1-phosphate uridylyltransferase